MLKLIGRKRAGNILLITFGALLVFHALVITGIIPYTIVWGGRLNSSQEMLKMEIVSVLMLLVVSFFVAHRLRYLRLIKGEKLVKVILWVFFGFFILNTLGNFAANNAVERYGFSFLTLATSLLLLRLLKD